MLLIIFGKIFPAEVKMSQPTTMTLPSLSAVKKVLSFYQLDSLILYLINVHSS